MSAFDDSIFQRITELVFLLSQLDEEMTVRKIAEITETSLEQTRKDLLDLHHYGMTISPEDIVEKFSLYENRYDDEPLFLVDEYIPDVSQDAGLLFLSPTEQSFFTKNKLGNLKIKDSPTSVPQEVEERAQTIEKAIRENRKITFRYKSPQDPASLPVTIEPRFLVFNVTDGLYYCISFQDDAIIAFRLDRMRFSVIIEKETCQPIDPNDSRLQRLTYVWGASFSSTEEPVHVLLEIHANTANLLGKIKTDISRRVHGKLYQKGDLWYYEDDIIGTEAFRRWLMSYGSSIKVLEPAAVADRLERSSALRLQYNLDGQFGEDD